jgi:hypothetical protein
MSVSDASPATAVERALNILEAAAQRRDGFTNSEISGKLGIPKRPRATFFARSSAAVTCDAKQKPGATAWV